MKTFSVRNLEQWQHYKDRNPPWIKLHAVLLNNYDFGRLPDASKAHALCIMVLASQCDNTLPWDPKWIGAKINATAPVNLELLVTAGVIEVKHDASSALADRKQSACVETEERREEIETEKTPPYPPQEGGAIKRSEIDWRIEQVWAAHLRQWERFYVHETGAKPSSTPTLTQEIRDSIRAAMLEHDRELLTPETRDEWAKSSKARGAGIGLFLDPWCSGKQADNDATNGGKRYLEHWRPWKRQRGKADPVEKYAELYFHRKELQRAGNGAV